VKGSPATAFELFLAERRLALKERESGLSKAELHTRVLTEWRQNQGDVAERRRHLEAQQTAAKERWRRQRPSPSAEGSAAAAALLVDQLAQRHGVASEAGVPADGDVAMAENAAPPSAKKRQKGAAATVHLGLSVGVLGGAGGAGQNGETSRCPRLALRSRAWPRWSDLAAALRGVGVLAAKPDQGALEPGSAGGKQLIGRSVLYHWADIGWCSGVIEKANGDRSKTVDGDMVNFEIYYDVDGDLSSHVLELGKYQADGPADSWVLLEEPVPVPELPGGAVVVSALLRVGEAAKPKRKRSSASTRQWTRAEEEHLRVLEAQHEWGKGNKWAAIAEQLGTGRSAKGIAQHWTIMQEQRRAKGQHAEPVPELPTVIVHTTAAGSFFPDDLDDELDDLPCVEAVSCVPTIEATVEGTVEGMVECTGVTVEGAVVEGTVEGMTEITAVVVEQRGP